MKPGGFAPGGFKLSYELPQMLTKAGRKELWKSSVKPGKSASRGRFSDGTARSARSYQAAALRKERALRRLGKESKTVTRRSLLTLRRKGTR